MKNFLALLILFLLFQSNTSKSPIIIKGSDTVFPLSQKGAEEYMKKNPSSVIIVNAGGSQTGITALLEKSCDIGMLSRKIKPDEEKKFKEAGIQLVEKIIAYDAIAIFVNKKNPIKKLTREQIEAIFTGKIKNWKELGGEDKKIVAFMREVSSGTHMYFKDHVLKNNEFSESCIHMPNTETIVQSVESAEGAIGFGGLAYTDESVKIIAVSYDGGKNYIFPNPETTRNNTYPISRPLYYYYNQTNETKVKPFIDFVLSAEGQKIVRLVGYIPVK